MSFSKSHLFRVFLVGIILSLQAISCVFFR
jgi:hypothetical protein